MSYKDNGIIESKHKLKAAKILLLTGAGASQDFGYSTAQNLIWDEEFKSQNALTENQVESSRAKTVAELLEMKWLIEKVRQILRVKNNGDDPIFEAIIMQLTRYKDIANAHNVDYLLSQLYQPDTAQRVKNRSIEKKLTDALTKCYEILLKNYGPQIINKNNPTLQNLPLIFKDLAGFNSDNYLDIYTTNYDCSYQVLGSRSNNVAFYSHINAIEKQPGLFIEDKWFRSRNDLNDEKLPKVFIHRLHGCVAWFDSRRVEGGAGFSYEKNGADASANLFEGITEPELNEMCVKLIATPLLGINRVFASAFEEFSEQLKSVEKLIVWGYSFRDLEVTRQINAALDSRERENNPLSVYYIDKYMPIDDAFQNIRKALQGAPVSPSKNLESRLHRIPWHPGEGMKKLSELLEEIIK